MTKIETIKQLAAFLLAIFVAISPCFAQKSRSLANLEQIPSTQLGSNKGGKYIDKSNNKLYYAKFYSNEEKTKLKFLTNKIYSLFELNAPESFLIKLQNPHSQKKELSLTTEWEKDLTKLFREFGGTTHDLEFFKKTQEELAKILLVSVLVKNWNIVDEDTILSWDKEYSYFDQFVTQADNLLLHNNQIFIIGDFQCGYRNEYSYDTVENGFRALTDPALNWQLAKIFSLPLKENIAKEPDKFIGWLNNHWDDNKVKTLIQESGIKNEEIFDILKSRLQKIKNFLNKIKEEKYSLHGIEGALERINRKLAKDGELSFIAKHVPYQYIESLPKAEKQVVICYNNFSIWLELQNYEFLINSKESNRRIVAYIGINNGQKIDKDYVINQYNVKREIVPILDPEAAYIFQNAIILYWNSIKTDKLSLEKAIYIGFNHLDYHFGSADYLENNESFCTTKTSFVELLSLINERIDIYKKKQKQLNRLITLEDIKRRETLGFIAYYPNPVYLGEIAWYLRPQNLTYKKYIQYKRIESNSGCFSTPQMPCKSKTLSKSSIIEFTEEDEYTPILEKLKEKYQLPNLKRISAYVFRGDSRPLEDILENEGFWSQPHLCEDSLDNTTCEYYNVKNNSAKLMEIDDVWTFGNLESPATGNKAYIATSREFGIAKEYGGHNSSIYAIFAKGGLDLPSIIADQDNSDEYIKEVAIPIGVKWQNIAGTRNKNGNHPTGPIFLKTGFELEDPKNFWEILQLFGDKPECRNMNIRLELIKTCEKFLNKLYYNIDMNCEDRAKFLGHNQKVAKAICSDNEKSMYFDHINGGHCPSFIRTTLGLQNARKRR